MDVRLSSKADALFPGLLAEPAPRAGIELVWLGQAGFLVRSAHASLVIDPYLSDSLAVKYRGREFAHERLVPVPVEPTELTGVHAVLATHAHTDHLDPGTLPGLAIANPEATFVVPRAHHALAAERGAPAARTVAINTGESFDTGEAGQAGGAGASPAATLRITAVPAAHEARELDADGNDRFLGYVIELAGVTLYHSGDCVPFAGLRESLAAHAVDIALLPVNGRDEPRASRGVPGNFTPAEAWELARAIGARYLVAHHWGMFAFNTADPAAVERVFDEPSRAGARGDGLLTLLPEL
ncbi:MAG: MBL fold metallo-hydrolase, partial [Spirochaetota bacterium]